MEHKIIIIFDLLLFIFKSIEGATHWVVTEEGKISVQDDSVFQLRRPYDLVALLHQEKRAHQLAQIKSQLIQQKHDIETDKSAGGHSHGHGHHGGHTIMITDDVDSDDIEQLVYASNDHCHQAGKPLTQFDLYVGTQYFMAKHDWDVLSDVNKIKKNKLIDRHVDKEFRIPNCSKVSKLDFSMKSYEHLSSIRQRDQLIIEPEVDLHQTISSIKSIDDYGNAIYEAFKQNSSSWLLFTMASYYWRSIGNAKESIECLRRALDLVPYHFSHIPLISLGNVLHRSKQSDEASIVIHSAIDVAPDSVIGHYTLGNIYAVMADFNKSVICFENVLKLDPEFEDAKIRKHAVLCHFNVEKALKAQHDNLQKTLEELQGYQKQQELWLQHQQKLLSEQAPPSVLLEQRLHYREYKIRELINSSNRKLVPGVELNSNGNSNGNNNLNSNSNTNLEDDDNESESESELTCSSIGSNGGKKGATNSGSADCHVVPILIPITFVPPSG